jgi:hypothetical protein
LIASCPPHREFNPLPVDAAQIVAQNNGLIMTQARALVPKLADSNSGLTDATSQLKPAGAVLLQLGVHGSFDLPPRVGGFRSAHSEIGLRVLQPAGLHEYTP